MIRQAFVPRLGPESQHQEGICTSQYGVHATLVAMSNGTSHADYVIII